MAHPEHRPATNGCRTPLAPHPRAARRTLSFLGYALVFTGGWTGICLGGLAGCGEPGSPQPPSLNLPVPVRNLSAQRSGDTVHLSWTTTDRTTDHTRSTGTITTRICRIQGVATAPSTARGQSPPTPTQAGGNPPVPPSCERVTDVRYKLGIASSYDDILPVTMTAGEPSLLTYYVELLNHAQKSAGGSNAAYAADGADLPALTGLSVSLRAEGVQLHWDTAAGPAAHAGATHNAIRIDRLRTSDVPAKAPKAGEGRANRLSPSAPPPQQTLELKEDTQATALDRSAAFGQTYVYRARRVASVTLDGHTIELLGEPSQPVTVETRDIFPPAVPHDLAAAADSRSHAIDLSWTPDTEPDLIGYIVYRHSVPAPGVVSNLLQRVSGPSPLPTPAFRDTAVQPGVRYAYSVSAVDQAGNESARSDEAEETLAPAP